MLSLGRLLLPATGLDEFPAAAARGGWRRAGDLLRLGLRLGERESYDAERERERERLSYRAFFRGPRLMEELFRRWVRAGGAPFTEPAFLRGGGERERERERESL